MWEEKDLLEMMRVNKKIYGSKINSPIFDNNNDYLNILYFQHRLLILLGINAYKFKNVDICYSGKGDISSISWKKDFSLTKKQCVDIGNFLLNDMITHLSIFDNKPFIDILGAKIIKGYLEENKPLSISSNYYNF